MLLPRLRMHLDCILCGGETFLWFQLHRVSHSILIFLRGRHIVRNIPRLFWYRSISLPNVLSKIEEILIRLKSFGEVGLDLLSLGLNATLSSFHTS